MNKNRVVIGDAFKAVRLLIAKIEETAISTEEVGIELCKINEVLKGLLKEASDEKPEGIERSKPPPKPAEVEMTLLDRYALQAMNVFKHDDDGSYTNVNFAEKCYKLADYMLREKHWVERKAMKEQQCS